MEQSSPGGRAGGGGGKYESGENTGKLERKLSLVVDFEAANKEEESKMKYKMKRLDKLKCRADTLIQSGLGELTVSLFRGSIKALFPSLDFLNALLKLYEGFALMLLFRQAQESSR